MYETTNLEAFSRLPVITKTFMSRLSFPLTQTFIELKCRTFIELKAFPSLSPDMIELKIILPNHSFLTQDPAKVFSIRRKEKRKL